MRLSGLRRKETKVADRRSFPGCLRGRKIKLQDCFWGCSRERFRDIGYFVHHSIGLWHQYDGEPIVSHWEVTQRIHHHLCPARKFLIISQKATFFVIEFFLVSVGHLHLSGHPFLDTRPCLSNETISQEICEVTRLPPMHFQSGHCCTHSSALYHVASAVCWASFINPLPLSRWGNFHIYFVWSHLNLNLLHFSKTIGKRPALENFGELPHWRGFFVSIKQAPLDIIISIVVHRDHPTGQRRTTNDPGKTNNHGRQFGVSMAIDKSL